MGDRSQLNEMGSEKRRSGSLRLLQALFPERFEAQVRDPYAEFTEQDEALPADRQRRATPQS